MPAAPSILFVDSDTDDCELGELMLARTWPEAAIARATDAGTFAECVGDSHPDAIIVAPDLSWAPAEQILQLLKRRYPDAALLMFGAETELVQRTLQPGIALDGVVAKTSAGFLSLPKLVGEALDRRQRSAVPASFLASIDDLPVAALATNREGQVMQVNEAMLNVLGMSDEEVTDAMLSDLLADGAEVEAWQSLRSEPRRHAATRTLALRTAHGASVRIAVRALGGSDQGPCFLGCADTVRTSADAAPAAHPGAADLPAQQLRDIAMVFSHDLKEPVQLIERLCRRLSERSEFGPGNPASKWISQIQQCSDRTSDMLDSMLEYLAVSARDASPGFVDLNKCLEQALNNLRPAIDEANAEITADHLPSIAGDEYQMLHLFQNLISNAIKFRSRDRLMLRITVEPDGEQWRIAFTDNGIGIAEPYAERVFEMGQRLHTHDEYPGTGVGLAICRRIIERHGGRIWVQPNDGSGCTFYVSLPQTPSHVTRLA